MQSLRSFRVSLIAFVAALACALSLAAAAPAWADSYTLALQADSNASSLSVGSEFTVSEVLTADNQSEFTMYALSSTVTYDSSKLELTGVAAGQYGVATIQSGNAVYNALSGPFAGTVIDSPFTMCTATFKVLAEGDSTISFKRASVSTYSGMHSFPVTTQGLTVSTATVTPATPEATEPGTATSDEAKEDSKDQMKKNVASVDDLLDNGKLTKAAMDNAYKAGFSNDELKTLGLTQDEIDRANNGEEVVPANATTSDSTVNTGSNTTNANASNNASTGNKESTNLNISTGGSTQNNGGIPIVPIVVVVIIVIVAAIIGGVAYSKSKKKTSDQGASEPTNNTEDTDTKE